MRRNHAFMFVVCWALALALAPVTSAQEQAAGPATASTAGHNRPASAVTIDRSSIEAIVALPQRKMYVKTDEAFLNSLPPREAPAVGLEIWMSRDRGATWTRYLRQVDTRKSSPVRFRADGIYEVLVVKVPSDESRHVPPLPGASPHLSILVDTLRPSIRILAPAESILVGAGSPVEIAWDASDANPLEEGVELEFSPDGGASWIRIAGGLSPSGSHLWMTPEIDLGRYTVRAVATDLAGNESSATAPGCVQSDGLAPACGFAGAPKTDGTKTAVSFWARDMGPAGLEKVLLWASEDDGASWKTVGAASPSTNELTITLAPGTYRLALSATDTVGNALSAPEPGSPGQVAVAIAAGQGLVAVKTEPARSVVAPVVRAPEPISPQIEQPEPVVHAPERVLPHIEQEKPVVGLPVPKAEALSVTQLLALAQERYEQTDYPRTKEYYQRVLGSDPDNATAHLGLGRVYVLTRGFSYSAIRSSLQAAEFEFERAIECDAALAAAYCGLGHVYALRGDKRNRILAAFEKAVDLEPDDAIFRYDYGLELKRASMAAVAAVHLEKCLELKPDYDKALYVLAECRMKLRQWTRAADTWERLVTVAGPDSELGRYALKRLALVRGKL